MGRFEHAERARLTADAPFLATASRPTLPRMASACSPLTRKSRARRMQSCASDTVSRIPTEAETLVALGGDGFMLQTLHAHARRRGRNCPVFGMNRGTVGFLMNEWRLDGLRERVDAGQGYPVAPLGMTATTHDGEKFTHPAINEVSLLRETRQTARSKFR